MSFSGLSLSEVRPAECRRISSFIFLTSSISLHLSVAVVMSQAMNCICLSVIMASNLLSGHCPAMSCRIRCLMYPALFGTLSSFVMMSCSVFFMSRMAILTVWAL